MRDVPAVILYSWIDESGLTSPFIVSWFEEHPPATGRGAVTFAEALRDAADDALVEALFDVLADGTKLPLSPTRMPRDVEDRLCYICVPPVEVSLDKFWGTRTHTVFLVRADGRVEAVERSRLPGESDVREKFSIF